MPCKASAIPSAFVCPEKATALKYLSLVLRFQATALKMPENFHPGTQWSSSLYHTEQDNGPMYG